MIIAKALFLALGLLTSAVPLIAREAYPPVDVLLETQETVIGQPIVYPDGPASITVAIVTMLPGQETGWHQHVSE